MKCSNCDSRLPKVGFYCTKCGFKIEKPDYVSEDQLIQPETKRKIIQIPKSESLQFKTSLIAKRRVHQKKLVLKFWAFMTLLCFSLFFLTTFGLESGTKLYRGFPGFLIFAWVVLSFLSVLARFALRKNVNESEYYTIPGSRNEKGYHRCIHCGGHGVARHQGWVARCHRCQTILFSNR
jgi:ribosomal protein L37AE/L43A